MRILFALLTTFLPGRPLEDGKGGFGMGAVQGMWLGIFSIFLLGAIFGEASLGGALLFIAIVCIIGLIWR